MGRLTLDFELDFGAIPWDTSGATMEHNTELLTKILNENASYNALLVSDKVYHFYPGIYARDIDDFHLRIMGTLRFHRPPDGIRVTMDASGTRPDPCIWIQDSSNILITSLSNETTEFEYDDDIYNETGNEYEYNQNSYGSSTSRGVIDGYGSEYWGVPLVGYVQLGERRPNLFVMNGCSDVVIEYMIFKDAPLYTMYLREMYNLTVRYSSVVARRTTGDGHGIYDLSAFNTDGIDVSGQNVHIHDVDVWNQDDCIAVKDGSSDMLFERITASGLGLTVGSIGGSSVRNITFRDSLLYKSFKGIHMKFRDGGGGVIEDVTFENITIVQPEFWGIWIGPAQQSISGNVCYPNPCSLCWPGIPFAECNGILNSHYRNITLSDIHIFNPLGSPGVIIGHGSNPIDGLLFHNVRVYPDELPSWFDQIHKRALFPGLNEASDIDDKYMQPGYGAMYIVCMIMLFVGIGIVSLSFGIALRSAYRDIFYQQSIRIGNGWKGTKGLPLISSDDDTTSTPSLEREGIDSNKAFVHVTGVGFILFILYLILRPHIESMDVDSYFVCEGAINARATGNTWPIPSCFEDATGMSS